MAGKNCHGAAQNSAIHVVDTRSFCEGLAHRTATNGATIGDNPHVAGSEAADAWDRGWTVGQEAGGTTVDPANAPCCAVNSTKTIVP